ncbi:hypothetical protein D9M69_179980 [compost metagenome]
MPSAAWLAPCGLDAMREAGAELVASTANGFVGHDDTALEQQLLDVAQTQVKAKIPAHRAADDDRRRKPVAMLERFLLHRLILPDRIANLTTPSRSCCADFAASASGLSWPLPKNGGEGRGTSAYRQTHPRHGPEPGGPCGGSAPGLGAGLQDNTYRRRHDKSFTHARRAAVHQRTSLFAIPVGDSGHLLPAHRHRRL